MAGRKEAASVSHKQRNGQTIFFILVVCCRLPGPFPATLAVSMAILYSSVSPSQGGLLSYVHVGDRSWTGGNSAFSCVITSSPSVSLFLPLLLFLLHVGLRGSADLGSVALLHQPLLVVCLAQDHVVLQEKLVSHTKPAPCKETEEGRGLHKHQSKNLIISTEL